MPNFASIELSDVPLARTPVLLGVYRYQPLGFVKYQLLSNVRVIAIQLREGPDPGLARFRYVFNPADPSMDPTSFEQALSVDIGLDHVVKNDERLVVLKYNPDGTSDPIFDGFAQVPELSLTPSHELVTFVAYGVAIREWDTPLGGALMRNADDPTSVKDVETDLPTFFNPEGQPNATPENADARDKSGKTFPTFLDNLVARSPDLRRKWTLPMAARYLCYHQNPDETYVKNPDGRLLDTLLDSRSPNSGVSMNLSSSSSYKSEPIFVSDFLATGKPWPLALHELLEPNGFGMVFRLEMDEKGDPLTRLDVFRRQDGSPSSYKDLYLQLPGQALDPSQTNLAQARLARDIGAVANVYKVDTRSVRYEASFVLAPGFTVAPTDAIDASTIKSFERSAPSFRSNRDRYRLYVFDETGEGHWNFGLTSLTQDIPSLKKLFVDDKGMAFPYVKRRRIPAGELFTLDANQKPLKARLAISTDYKGSSPGLWDGTGTWQTVVGGFDLVRDRLGIWINVPNPNGWNIGMPATAGMPYPTGIVRGVEDQANQSAAHFLLRLTCVVEGDQSLNATAGQRPSSTTSFAITRRIDASNRYFKQIVTSGSEFNLTAVPVVSRDDTKAARAEASARRLAGESGEVAGSATIPRFTSAYQIGDKIRSIQGRNLSLRTNAGAPSEEGEVFPSVVAVSWDFEGKQQTMLQLSDQRGERR
ncbi:MAG: hypothetical protein NVSMB9_01410 [Isosphaeraceae bacterium]